MLWAVYVTNYGSDYFKGVSFSTDGIFIVAHFTTANIMVLVASNATAVMMNKNTASGSYN